MVDDPSRPDPRSDAPSLVAAPSATSSTPPETNRLLLDELEQGPGRALVWGLGLIILAIMLMVWRSSLDGAFQFDDHGNILSQDKVDHIWPVTPFLSSNRPIGLYSLAVNKHFGGESPRGYHIFNLLVHAINAMLIYAGILLSRQVWRRSLGRESETSHFWLITAALVSIFWAVHPLTTQAVTYIVQRYESLTAMGYLGVWVGLLMVLVGRQRKHRLAGYAAIAVFAWIGLMSKEVFASAPLSVLLFDRQLTRQPFMRILRQRWPAYVWMASPFVWFVPSVSRWFDPSRSSSMGMGMEQLNSWEYLRTQPEVILYYLKLAVWPHPQSIDYVWRIQQRPEIYLSLGAVIVSMITAGGWLYIRGLLGALPARDDAPDKTSDTETPVAPGLFGWGVLTFFFILAPTSSIMPIADLAFEHRMYLPLALVVAGLTIGSACLIRRLWLQSNNRPVLAMGTVLIAVAVGGALAWRTHVRNLDYRNEFTLWIRVTEVAPENPRGWYNVGRAIYQRGHHDDALPYLISAVGFGGTKVPIYDVGLADCLHRVGRVDEALFFYKRAIENKPGFEQAHNNLGVVYLDQDEDEMAFRHFKIAADLEHAEAMHNLAMIYERRGDTEQAITWLRRAIATAKVDDQVEVVQRSERRLQSNIQALTRRSKEAPSS